MEGASKELTLSIGPPPAKRIRTEEENRESAIELDLSLSPPRDRRSAIDLSLNLSLNGRYGPRPRIDAAGKAPMMYPVEEAPTIRTGSDAAAKGKAPMVFDGTPQRRGIGAQAMRGTNLNRGQRVANLDGGPRLVNLNGGQRFRNMPYVTTSSPMLNYGKAEGILYRYRMSEELKIFCVCHGMFMSPREFIKHGGGGDVDDPLKYISISPFNIFRG